MEGQGSEEGGGGERDETKVSRQVIRRSQRTRVQRRAVGAYIEHHRSANTPNRAA